MPRYEALPANNPAMPSANAALMPPFVHNAATGGAWWQNLIQGAPGTMGVNSPKPGVHPESSDPRVAGSYNSPDVFFPTIYTADPKYCHGPVPVISSNMMPVPAVLVDNLAGIAMKRPRIGGQNQVSQPGVTQSWPDLYARNNGTSNGNAGWRD
jgi:hypothetical protein